MSRILHAPYRRYQGLLLQPRNSVTLLPSLTFLLRLGYGFCRARLIKVGMMIISLGLVLFIIVAVSCATLVRYEW